MMLNPSYALTLGQVSVDPSKQETADDVSVQMGLQVPANAVKVAVHPTSATSRVKIGDPVNVDLGYDSSLTRVFAGMVDTIEIGTAGLRIGCLSEMSKLLKLRVSQTYLSQNAGQITRDICSKAQISVGDVQDGVSLPSFSVSHESPAYDYLKELADKSGFDLYISPDSKLNFKSFKANLTHTLEYGINVLGVQAVQGKAPSAVKVFGESPSSSSGSNTSHWLTKDNVEGSAGNGEQLVFSDASIKDKSTAGSVAKSRLSQARDTFQVRIWTLGNPAIKLGDAAFLKGFVNPSLKGDFKVFAIEHSLTKKGGFITTLDCSRRL